MSKTKFTPQDIADRFEEAVRTMHRLPSAKVQGYFNTWPAMMHEAWEIALGDPGRLRLGPPSAEAIDRMDEVVSWLTYLTIEDRKLIWLRAERVPWRPICERLGVSRATANRRYQAALNRLARRLS